MNDKIAHSKLKKIQEENNSYKNSRRSRNEGHKIFSETIRDIKDNGKSTKSN